MDSDAPNSYQVFLDACLRRGVIDAPLRDRLLAIWRHKGWTNGAIQLYTTLGAFAGIFVICSSIAGIAAVARGDFPAGIMGPIAESLSLVSRFALSAAAVPFQGLWRTLQSISGVCEAAALVLETPLRCGYWFVLSCLEYLAHLADRLLILVCLVPRQGMAAAQGLVMWAKESLSVLWAFLLRVASTIGTSFSSISDAIHRVGSELFRMAAEHLAPGLQDAGRAICRGFHHASHFTLSCTEYMAYLGGRLLSFLCTFGSCLERVAAHLMRGLENCWFWISACASAGVRTLMEWAPLSAEWVVAALRGMVRRIVWWYWITVASEWKIAGLAALSTAVDLLGRAMARQPRYLRWMRSVHMIEAALITWLLGHIIELAAIRWDWRGLEIASMGMWCILPLFIAVITGMRPLLTGVFSLAMLLVHLAVFAGGISGNALVPLDVALAVIVLAGTELVRNSAHSGVVAIRYGAMGVLGFILYCCGLIWDVPAVIEFRHFADPLSLNRTAVFLAGLFLVAGGFVVIAYRSKGPARTRTDLSFTLLLLFTLFLSTWPSGLLLQAIAPGTLRYLSGSRHLNTFADNILIATAFAWAGWFVWCVWLLVESSLRERTVMAQIAVAALLGSLETRYIELVANVSFLAGLVVVPVMAVAVFAEIRIIRRWLERLGGGRTGEEARVLS